MDTRQTLTPDDPETTLTMNDGDHHVRINTAQRTASGHFGSTEWAEFTCPKDRFNLGAAARPKREMTDGQRQSIAARLNAHRAATIAKETK